MQLCPSLAARIFADYNGINHYELARKYRLSLAEVYQAINQAVYVAAASFAPAEPSAQDADRPRPRRHGFRLRRRLRRAARPVALSGFTIY